MAQNWLTNALSRKRGGPTVIHRNWPLPKPQLESLQGSASIGFTVVIMLIIALALVPTSQANFIVKEKESGAKSQQVIAGVNYIA